MVADHPLRPWGRTELLLGLLIVVVSAVLRWHDIGDRSLWLDEIGEAVVATSGDGLFAGIRNHAAAAPLDYLGVMAAIELFGTSTVAVRSFAFAMGVLAVVLTLVAGWLTSGSPRVALLAAAILALAPFHIYYAQEARFYALSTACAAALIATFAIAVRTRRAVAWAGYAVVIAVSLYSHYLLALLVAAQGLALTAVAVVRSRQLGWRAGLGACVRTVGPAAIVVVVAIVAFLPWLTFAGMQQAAVDHGYVPDPVLGPERLVGILATLIAPSTPMTAAAAVLVFLLVGLMLYGAWRWRSWDLPSMLALVGVVVVAIPLGYLANAVSSYRFAERQIIFLLPAIAILAGAGLAAVFEPQGARRPGHRRRWLAVGIAASMVALAIPSLTAVYDGTWRIKEDWRGAAGLAVAEVCPGGRVLVNLGPSYANGIGWYQPSLLDSIEALELSGRGLLVDLRELDITADDVVVVLVPVTGVFAPGVGGIDEAGDFLAGRGLREHEFTTRLRVFASRGPCLAAIGPRPAGTL
jgi:mannosyltransferase